MEQIKQVFSYAKQQNRAVLGAYVTAGYPIVEETVDILLGLANGGAGMYWLSPSVCQYIVSKSVGNC